jgi:hypothetical protein
MLVTARMRALVATKVSSKARISVRRAGLRGLLDAKCDRAVGRFEGFDDAVAGLRGAGYRPSA